MIRFFTFIGALICIWLAFQFFGWIIVPVLIVVVAWKLSK